MRFRYSFFFNDTATIEIYTVSDTLSLHDALPISLVPARSRLSRPEKAWLEADPQSRSEEHTSELQSPDTISYADFCLKKKKKKEKTIRKTLRMEKKKNNMRITKN